MKTFAAEDGKPFSSLDQCTECYAGWIPVRLLIAWHDYAKKKEDNSFKGDVDKVSAVEPYRQAQEDVDVAEPIEVSSEDHLTVLINTFCFFF